jgi:very-short-patch-repair endonuclease
MRRLFVAGEPGLTRAALRWGEETGRWRRIGRGVYGAGSAPPSPLERALVPVVRNGSMATGRVAGVLLGLDGVELGPARARSANEESIDVEGVRCTNGLQTLIDLAAVLDDLRWEQALESALRKRLVTIADLEAALAELGRARIRGTARIRRVLQIRPPGARATESLLETLMVQLIRTLIGVPPAQRQVDVFDRHGQFVARVDLAWPELGLFLELDGQHHAGQPVYDARRETAVVATMGWLVGRFTWTEVVRYPKSTGRRLAALVERASERQARSS